MMGSKRLQLVPKKEWELEKTAAPASFLADQYKKFLRKMIRRR
jgi:hypothetical protein